MMSQRYLPGSGSSCDQNQRTYATEVSGKFTGSVESSTFPSGPTSDQRSLGLMAWLLKRWNV